MMKIFNKVKNIIILIIGKRYFIYKLFIIYSKEIDKEIQNKYISYILFEITIS